MKLRTITPVFFLFACVVLQSTAQAQANNYTQTNLVSNVPGLALTMDTDLVHPWGLAISPNQPFRIAANGKGKFRSYDASGIPQDPRGIIAVPAGVTAPANPTGVAANTTGLFMSPESPLPLPFLFATRQGRFPVSTRIASMTLRRRRFWWWTMGRRERNIRESPW